MEKMNPVVQRQVGAVIAHRQAGIMPCMSSIELTSLSYRPDAPEMELVCAQITPQSAFSCAFGLADPMNRAMVANAHHHNYFELMYILDGAVHQYIENERHLYTAGSLCLLNRNIRHREEFDSRFQALYVAIPPALAKELFLSEESSLFRAERVWKDLPLQAFIHRDVDRRASAHEYIDFIPVPGSEGELTAMRRRFEQLALHFIDPVPGSTYFIKGLLIRILHTVFQPELYSTTPIKVDTPAEARLFMEIDRLLEASDGRLSRRALASQLHYNGGYLNEIVRKYTGMSIFQYGNVFCMKQAAHLLESSNLSVQQITEQLRFSNRSHFYRLFQSYWHMTPREYRLSRHRTENLQLRTAQTMIRKT